MNDEQITAAVKACAWTASMGSFVLMTAAGLAYHFATGAHWPFLLPLGCSTVALIFGQRAWAKYHRLVGGGFGTRG